MRVDRDRRGVSEVIAFVFVFGIVIGSVGFLYTSGFGAMSSMQEAEQLQNAERAMGALAQNFNDIERDGVAERKGELELREGRVSVDDGGTRLTIEVNGSSDPIEIDGETFDNRSIGAVTYERGSSSIAYEGGGVFRGERSGNVSIEDPPVACNEDRGVAIVSLVVVDAESRSIQSSGGVELEAIEQNRTVVTRSTDVDTVSITIEESAYANGWASALERNGWSEAASDDSYSCNVDRLTIRIVAIDVNL